MHSKNHTLISFAVLLYFFEGRNNWLFLNSETWTFYLVKAPPHGEDLWIHQGFWYMKYNKVNNLRPLYACLNLIISYYWIQKLSTFIWIHNSYTLTYNNTPWMHTAVHTAYNPVLSKRLQIPIFKAAQKVWKAQSSSYISRGNGFFPEEKTCCCCYGLFIQPVLQSM